MRCEYADPNEAACDTDTLLGHSRVGGNFSMLLQCSQSFWNLQPSRCTRAIPPCLRAKVITQLCTHSWPGPSIDAA